MPRTQIRRRVGSSFRYPTGFPRKGATRIVRLPLWSQHAKKFDGFSRRLSRFCTCLADHFREHIRTRPVHDRYGYLHNLKGTPAIRPHCKRHRRLALIATAYNARAGNRYLKRIRTRIAEQGSFLRCNLLRHSAAPRHMSRSQINGSIADLDQCMMASRAHRSRIPGQRPTTVNSPITRS